MNGPRHTARPGERQCAMGLDVGGTKIAAGLVDWSGTVLERRVMATEANRGGQPVLDDALRLARDLKEVAKTLGFQVAALGVGVCELVDPEGRVISEHTIRWRGLPLRDHFDVVAPALVEADSRAAAFCEGYCGAGKPFSSFYYVTIGTGIGGSWVVDGRPWAGTTGCAGTLASSPMSVLCGDCGTVTRVVLEEVASGPALVRRYNARARLPFRSAEDVLKAAAAEDPHAEWVVDTAADSLGATLGLLVNVLDPAAVIVGGGLGSAPGRYWENLTTSLRRHIWSDSHRGLPVLQARCGGDSGFIGAALRAWTALAPKPSK